MVDHVTSIVGELNKRYRFDQIDNMLPKPTEDEIGAAVYDAVSDINNLPPVSSYTLDWIMTVEDPRWRSALYLASGRNVARMLVADWTARGFTMQIDEFNVEDRLERMRSLAEELGQQFEARVGALKEAAGKFSRLVRVTQNPLTGRTFSRTGLWGPRRI